MKKLMFVFLPLLFAAFAFTGAQNLQISGTVTDERGGPIENATVRSKTSNVRTDANGAYKLSVAADEKYLSFSSVGFETKQELIAGRMVINVIMRSMPQELQSVVVTSATPTRRPAKELGYATSRISNAEISNGLSGRISGLQVNGGNINDSENREGYANISENGFRSANTNPVSTFSIDVDAASYSNVRRFLNSNTLPPAGAVRSEEMINYFKYDYPQPVAANPFSINTEISNCPWNSAHKLLLIGLQGKTIPTENLPASNIVFLIDVSGSMQMENKLPLVKSSMKLLTDQLREQDRISIVAYAGNAGLVLGPTSGAEKTKIKNAIDALEAGGSTAGGAGIKLAYKVAQENKKSGGNNRVILCTDGDFNVGASSDDEMAKLIESERSKGIFLTVLGYGMGNYQDSKMQQLADKGNGNHAYIDGLSEANKVLVSEFGGTIFTIAKDVKLQLEFNPSQVAGYRLIGYENRLLNREDFHDDAKDAGEMGSGHTVTALYEIIPAGVTSSFLKKEDPLKYQTASKRKRSGDLVTIKFRYKEPEGSQSKLIEHSVSGKFLDFATTTDNFRFAASVAGFGMLLRNSEFKGTCNWSNVEQLAKGSIAADKEGYRREFLALVGKARTISAGEASNAKAIKQESH